eukprot:gene5598-6287_t
MSLLGNIFGSSKSKEKAPSTSEAITRLRETMDLLDKKSAFLEKKIQAETMTAKQNASKDKRVALQALKRKKKLHKQLNQLDGALTTLEYQVEALESANTNSEIVTSMKFAADALKKAQMDPDDVHDIMDDIAEQRELTDEISNAISTFGQNNLGVDEDELEKELLELEEEDIELEEFPEAPISKLPSIKTKREEGVHMKELEAWASG